MLQNYMPQMNIPSLEDVQSSLGQVKPNFTLANFLGDSGYAPARSNALMYLSQGLMDFGKNYASGKGFSASIGAGAEGALNKYKDVQNFNTYKPYFNQMGINTDNLNPATGGGGFGELSATKLIDLQDTLENREFNRMYKTQYLDSLKDKQENQQTNLKTLMGISPAMANRYQNMVDPNGNYDFTGGKNQSYLENTLKNMGTDINNPINNQLAQSILQNKDNIGVERAKQIKVKTELAPQELELKKRNIDARIAQNNQRIAISKQKMAKGDSSAKAEYNSLRNENMKLSIQQKQLINNMLQKGGKVPPVVNNDPLELGL